MSARVLSHWGRPRERHGRGLDDRGGRLAVEDERVDQLLEVLDVADVDAHDEAVLAGDPQALDDLRRRAREVGDLGDHARRGADPDHRRERVAERARVDARRIPGDRRLVLELAQAVGDRRRREPDAAPELREAQPARRPGALRSEGDRHRSRRAIRSHAASEYLRSALVASGHPTRACGGRPSPASSARAVPPEAYFVGSAVFHYLGPAFAVLLFARVAPLGVAWLRILTAAVVFALWRRERARPVLRDRVRARLGGRARGDELLLLHRDRPAAARDRRRDRVPAVIVLAALGAQTPRNVGALALAVPGVYVLTGVHVAGEADRDGVRVRQRAAVRGLHRVRRPRGQAGGSASTASPAAMVLAALFVTPVGATARRLAIVDPGRRRRRASARRSSRTSATSWRSRAYRAPPTAYGRAAAGHGDGHRARRPGSGPDAKRPAGIGLVVAGVALHRP